MNERELIRSIRDEYEAETGERPDRVTASVYLDRMCDAFVHLVEGVGPEEAVLRGDRRVAEYLARRWGADGKRLRAALALPRQDLARQVAAEYRAEYEVTPEPEPDCPHGLSLSLCADPFSHYPRDNYGDF